MPFTPRQSGYVANSRALSPSVAHFLGQFRCCGNSANVVASSSVRCRSQESASTSSSDTYEFTYEGSDGRQKATFEQAFKTGGGGGASLSQAPWELGYQMAEKNLAWNDDMKTRLLVRVAAEKLNLPDEEVATRLSRIQALLPDLATRLPMMKPSIVIGLLGDADSLPARLVGIKATFPNADVSKLALREPALVLGFIDESHLSNIALQLREILPNLDVDRIVEENPSMLDIEELRAAMAEAERIMPGLDIQKAMGQDPQIILSFQKGSQLIPYDPPTPDYEDLDGSSNGASSSIGIGSTSDDEYAAYYG